MCKSDTKRFHKDGSGKKYENSGPGWAEARDRAMEYLNTNNLPQVMNICDSLNRTPCKT